MPVVPKKYDQFNTGELNQKLAGRSDLERYEKGAEVMVNVIPEVQGPAIRAWGSWLVSDSVFGTARLEPMDYGSGVEYLFVILAGFLRIYNTSGSVHQELAAPWTESQIFELDFDRELNTTVFTHEDMTPQLVQRNPSTEVFTLVDLTDTGNSLGIYIERYPSIDPISRWEADTIYPEGWLLVPTEGNETDYYYECTTAGATGSTEPTWDTTIGGTTADGDAVWTTKALLSSQNLWSDTNGWPRCVAWYEDRLIFGGQTLYKNRWVASMSGQYFKFDTTRASASYAIDKTLFSDKSSEIQWMEGGRTLVIGTAGGEWSLNQTTPLTPADSAVREQTQIGSARVKPVQVDGAVLHVTGKRSQLRELLYNDVELALKSTGLSVLNPLAIVNATQLAALTSVEEDDSNLVFCVSRASATADGYLGVFLTLREQNVAGFFRRTFDGSVESVAVLDDKIWLLVAYQYGPGIYEDAIYEDGIYEADGGTTLRVLCYIDPTSDPMVDYAQTITNDPAASTLSGLGSFAGEDVSVIADGQYWGEYTVAADGTVDLGEDVSSAIVGIPLPTPTMTLMPVSVTIDKLGNRDHAIKRIVQSLVEVQGSQQLTVNGEEKNFLPPDFLPGDTIEEVTGIFRTWHKGRERQPQLTITMPYPLKCRVRAVTLEVKV